MRLAICASVMDNLIRITAIRNGRYVDVFEFYPEDITDSDWFADWMRRYDDCHIFVTPGNVYPRHSDDFAL